MNAESIPSDNRVPGMPAICMSGKNILSFPVANVYIAGDLVQK